MPEGPEIRIAADRIERAIANQAVESVFFAFSHLKQYESILINSQVRRVDTRGKALLICWDNDLTIYTHNQLYGKWYLTKAGKYPQTKRQLRLAIHTAKKSALLYSASDIAVLNPFQVETHPFLTRIGPDILDPNLTIQQVQQRYSSKTFHRRRFTSLLLDQSFLAGNGNYLRSEILFVARLHPLLRPIDCSETEIEGLAKATLSVPRQSYQTKGITNSLEIVQRLKQQGVPRSVYRHWVFNREDQPCYVCNTAIVKDVVGKRRYYFCPYCQPAARNK